MSVPRLRDLLASDLPLIGTFVGLPSPYCVEILASSGFDWLCVDMQHGLVTDELLPSVILASHSGDTPAVVRTRWNEPSTIMRALDLGAAGVIVPLVNDAEEARAAGRATRFPPEGVRSFGPLRPLDAGQPAAQSNDDAICVVMIETAGAVEQARAIAEVSNIDGIFVGPSDLSLSVTGRLGSGTQGHVTRVAEACRSAGVAAGIACADANAAASAVAAGFRLLTVQWDVSMLANGAASLLASVASALEGQPSEAGRD